MRDPNEASQSHPYSLAIRMMEPVLVSFVIQHHKLRDTSSVDGGLSKRISDLLCISIVSVH